MSDNKRNKNLQYTQLHSCVKVGFSSSRKVLRHKTWMKSNAEKLNFNHWCLSVFWMVLCLRFDDIVCCRKCDVILSIVDLSKLISCKSNLFPKNKLFFSYQGKEGWAPASYLEKPAEAILRQSNKANLSVNKSLAENRRSFPGDLRHSISSPIPAESTRRALPLASSQKKHLQLTKTNSNPTKLSKDAIKSENVVVHADRLVNTASLSYKIVNSS